MHITEIVDAADLRELDTIWDSGERIRVTDVNRLGGLVSVSGLRLGSIAVYYALHNSTDPIRRSCSAVDAATLVDEAVAYLYAAADLAREAVREVVQMLELLDQVIRRLKGFFRDVRVAYQVSVLRGEIAKGSSWDDGDTLSATLETWAYDLAMEHTR